MNATFKSLEDLSEIDLYQEIESLIRKNLWTWQSVCAVLGLLGGVVAPLLGAISDLISWLLNTDSYLHVLSIVLCALTLPLLTLGAICLDFLETKNALQLHVSESTRPQSRATTNRLVAQQAVSHDFGRAPLGG